MGDVLVAGIGMTRFGRHPERSLEELAREALAAALADAGCAPRDVEAADYSGVTNGQLQGQFAIPGQVVLGRIGIEGVPAFNVENPCPSGSPAFHLAVQNVRAGGCDVALALGDGIAVPPGSVARPARARWPGPAMPSRRTAAASSASKRPRSPSTSSRDR